MPRKIPRSREPDTYNPFARSLRWLPKAPRATLEPLLPISQPASAITLGSESRTQPPANVGVMLPIAMLLSFAMLLFMNRMGRHDACHLRPTTDPPDSPNTGLIARQIGAATADSGQSGLNVVFSAAHKAVASSTPTTATTLPHSTQIGFSSATLVLTAILGAATVFCAYQVYRVAYQTLELGKKDDARKVKEESRKVDEEARKVKEESRKSEQHLLQMRELRQKCGIAESEASVFIGAKIEPPHVTSLDAQPTPPKTIGDWIQDSDSARVASSKDDPESIPAGPPIPSTPADGFEPLLPPNTTAAAPSDPEAARQRLYQQHVATQSVDGEVVDATCAPGESDSEPSEFGDGKSIFSAGKTIAPSATDWDLHSVRSALSSTTDTGTGQEKVKGVPMRRLL